MAITIDKVYVDTFERTVRHLAQQGESRLRRFVLERTEQSKSHAWERVGSVDAVEKTTARSNTPEIDTPWSRRLSIPKTYHVADTVEPEDVVKMLIEPKSNIAMAHAMSLRRLQDDIIIEAANGASRDGDGVAVAFDAGQQVGDGLSEISLDLTLQVQEKFLENDIQMDDMQRAVMVIGPKQQRKLLRQMEITSGDYQNMKALATGYLPNWLGFNWVVSTRLQAPALNQLDCLAFTPQGLGLQVNADTHSKVAEDPTKSFMWRIYCAMTMGAIRIEDEHVVRLRLADTVT